MDDMTAVVARLERVENENRRMKRAGLACLLASACVLVMGQARPGGSKLQAQEFVLQDASGTKRAELVLEAGAPGTEPSPVLRFVDGKGNEELLLTPHKLELAGKGDLGPDILLDDAKGASRIDLGLEHSQPFLILNDEKGIVREDMGLERGEPAFVINDEKATPRVGFGLSLGHPSVSVFDAEGYSAVFGSAPLETGGVARQTTAASINMFGSDGSLLWSAP